MSSPEKKRRTILHFGTDRVVLLLRARSLKEMGYQVLNANDGFEAIKLASHEQLDAVVADLDRNHADVALVVTEIKRSRPELPTILLAEKTTALDRAHGLADVLVPRRDNLQMLVTVLENALTRRRKRECYPNLEGKSRLISAESSALRQADRDGWCAPICPAQPSTSPRPAQMSDSPASSESRSNVRPISC